MKIDLHGGGVRFVANESVAKISPDTNRFTYGAFDLSGLRDPAALELNVVSEGELDQFLRPVLSDIAQSLLAQEPLPANRAGAVPLLRPRAYFRIVDDVADGDILPFDTLLALARAMKEAGDPQGSSSVPAIFTYLGQFIAHDVTHMKPGAAADDPDNFRTHKLDLDSIFGSVDPDCELPEGTDVECGIPVGRTRGGNLEDLARHATMPGRGVPCIPDTRNDNNLSVAQLTLAIMKFHRFVCRCSGEEDADRRMTITRRHFQSVVLHDYLPRIIDGDVYNDVDANGRSVIFPGALPFIFHIPVEFAAACFRFGHSQVRHEYDWNADAPQASLLNMLGFTHLGGQLSRIPRLPDDWVADWDRMLTGQMGHAIDGRMTWKLHRLPDAWIEDANAPKDQGSYNLAHLTLHRGRTLRLPSAQSLQAFLVGPLGAGTPETQPISPGDMLDPDTRAHLTASQAVEIETSTPLWWFVLREAQLRGAGGQHLGPLASRIVMETLHAAIEATPDNIISKPFEVHEKISAASRSKFRLADLIACAGAA